MRWRGVRILPPPTPLEQLNAQQTRGHEVFQAQCAGATTTEGTVGCMGLRCWGFIRSLRCRVALRLPMRRVTATIMLGRGMMPAMRDKVDQQDLDDLLAYLHTL